MNFIDYCDVLLIIVIIVSAGQVAEEWKCTSVPDLELSKLQEELANARLALSEVIEKGV